MCNKWYGTEEVCQKLGYSKRHIYRLMKNGQITYFKPIGRIFFDKDYIDSWYRCGKSLSNQEVSQISNTYLHCYHNR
jgi:excisionase family DNA binding protein